jgi:hypothetical protein
MKGTIILRLIFLVGFMVTAFYAYSLRVAVLVSAGYAVLFVIAEVHDRRKRRLKNSQAEGKQITKFRLR